MIFPMTRNKSKISSLISPIQHLKIGQRIHMNTSSKKICLYENMHINSQGNTIHIFKWLK